MVDCIQLAATIEADEALLTSLEDQVNEVEERLLTNWMLWWYYCGGMAASSQSKPKHDDSKWSKLGRRLAQAMREEESRRNLQGDDS